MDKDTSLGIRQRIERIKRLIRKARTISHEKKLTTVRDKLKSIV